MDDWPDLRESLAKNATEGWNTAADFLDLQI